MDEVSKSFLRPIKNTSVVQQVINRLTNAMINKELRPGDKVPTELELSESLGIGRNSIREAIKVLVSFGVLEIRRPEGTFVTTGMSDKMLDPLLYGIILEDSDSQVSLKELREWIDIGIIKLARKNADKNDMSRLEQALNDIKKALDNNDAAELFIADDNFHLTMAESSHNPLFVKIGTLTRKLTSQIRTRTVENIIAKGMHEAMYQVHYDMVMALHGDEDGDEQTDLQKLVDDGYFYDHGILD